MKSIRKISQETGVDYFKVFRTIRKEGLIVEHSKRGKGTKMMLTIHQEDYIHDVLYYSGYFTELTIESKMNQVETKEELFQQFREFKLKTYTR